MSTPNSYYVRIISYETDEITHQIGPISYLRKAEKAEAGLNRNLNHDDYYTDLVWIGPAPEPTED